MAENQRDFKGVWIPKEIWLDTRLNMLEKGILAEIDSLDNDEYGCFASNKYLAEFCQCGETKVSTAISKLIKFGYIYIKSFDGRQRILKSRLSNFERQTFKKCKADLQNLKDNNIDNNIFNNKDNNNIECTHFKKPTLEEVEEYCNERQNNIDPQRFIDYYTANGWKVGRNSMKNWKAAVRVWEKTSNNKSVQAQKQARQEESVIDRANRFLEMYEQGEN